MSRTRLPLIYFQGETLSIAQDLLGKNLVRQFDDGSIKRYRITETEAYCGEEDLACHASKGRTSRTEIMYQPGGVLYVYLIYGMYWLLNVVTEKENNPSAVLIRGLEGFSGPGRVGRQLQLDKSFYGEDLSCSTRIWVEDHKDKPAFETATRIGVDYAGEWAIKPWRFMVAGQ